MVGQNVACLGQFALSKHIAIAELLFVDGYIAVAVAITYYFSPVYATAVDGATVVEYNATNIRIFHCLYR